jgi:RNA polymerase subunit RPABC4/transcription elongation factor Spt4
MNIDVSNIIEKLYEWVTFEVFIKFVIVYFFIIWIAILLWVIKDISNRTSNTLLQIISILVILFLTPFWIFIYLLIRPGKTLFEKYYEEIEENLDTFNQIIEDKTRQCEAEDHCFSCEEPISHNFKFCPKCKTVLKRECFHCSKLLYSDWKVCPYCWKKQKKLKIKKDD